MASTRLKDKVAIITGGGSGFGAGIVKKFIAEGCRVLIWDINSGPLNELAASLGSDTVTPYVGDVSKLADWTVALERCLEAFGKLDIVVNNAGVVHIARASEQVEEEEVDRMYRINVKPLYHSAKTIIPYFKKEKRGGVVINLSSISAPRPRPKLVWYAASKGAVTAVGNDR